MKSALRTQVDARGSLNEPSNLFRINVEPNEFTSLLLGQVIRVRLVDPELLQTLEHDGSKGTNSLLRGAETVEESFVGLSRLVEVSSRDGGGEQVVRGSSSVDITCEQIYSLDRP